MSLPKVTIRVFCFLATFFLLGVVFYLVRSSPAVFAQSTACQDRFNVEGCWTVTLNNNSGGDVAGTFSASNVTPGSGTVAKIPAGSPKNFFFSTGTCLTSKTVSVTFNLNGGAYRPTASATATFLGAPGDQCHAPNVSVNVVGSSPPPPPPTCNNGRLNDASCRPGISDQTKCVGVFIYWSKPSGGDPGSYSLSIDGGGAFSVSGFKYGPYTASAGSSHSYTVYANYSGFSRSSSGTLIMFSDNNPGCVPRQATSTPLGCNQTARISWTGPSSGETPTRYRVWINGAETDVGLALSYTFNTSRNTDYDWAVRSQWGSVWFTSWISPRGGADFTSYGNSQCAPAINVYTPMKCINGGGTAATRDVDVTFNWNQPSAGAPSRYEFWRDGVLRDATAVSGRSGPFDVNQNFRWEVKSVWGGVIYSNGLSPNVFTGDCVPGAFNLSFTYTCTNGNSNPTANLSWSVAANNSVTDVVRYDVDRAQTVGGGSTVTLATNLAGTSYSTTVTRGQSVFFRIKTYYPNKRFGTDFTNSNVPPGGAGGAFIGVATNMNGQLNAPLCDADITNSGPFNQTLSRKLGGSSVDTRIRINRNRGWDWPVGLWIGPNSAASRGDATKCLKTKANAVTVGNIQIWCPDLDSASNVSFPPAGASGAATITIFIDENAPIANTQFKVFACDYTAHADGFTLSSLNSGDLAIVTNCIVSNPVLVTVPAPDLKLEFKRPDPCSENSRYTVNDNATCNFTVTNVGGSNSTSTIIGLWRIPRDRAAEPANWCRTTPNSPPAPPPDLDVNVPALNPNAVTEVSHTFPVGNDPRLFTLVGYVNPLCGQQESSWVNNGPVRQTYTVDTDSWFKTTEGDVGSAGAIAAPPLTPPAGEFNSDFLIVSGGGQTSVLSKAGWTIKNYNLPLDVPGQATVFDYLKEHFYDQTNNLLSKCDISSGNHEGWNVCRGNAIYKTSAPNGVPVIWFVVKNSNGIGGNLTIEDNMIGSTAIFIAEGDIVINTTVTQVDAVLIAKGTIKTYGAATSQGPQLVINGAMYGGSVDLNRNCNISCSNQTDPTVTVNFKPKYLSILKDWLGTSTMTWQEVAP